MSLVEWAPYLPAMTFFGLAAGMCLQAYLALRKERAMRTIWRILEGTVATAEPEIRTGSEGTLRTLHLSVDTAEGLKTPCSLTATSDGKLGELIAAYPVGGAIALRVDPKTDEMWVDGCTPDIGAGCMFGTAIGFAILGLAAWFMAPLGMPQRG